MSGAALTWPKNHLECADDTKSKLGHARVSGTTAN